MIAGTQEYMAMEKLYSLRSDEKFDLIVVDTPPAKQAVDFLTAPLRMMNMINDSLLRWLVAPTLKMGTLSSKIFGALSTLSGKEIWEEIARFLQIIFSMLEGFTRRSESIQNLLLSRECAFIMVADLPRTSSLEGRPLGDEFERLGFELEAVVLNRTPSSFGTEREIRLALQWAEKQKEPVWHAAKGLLEKNRLAHRKAEEKLKSLAEEIPHHALIPEMPEGVSRLDDLRKMADFMEV